MSFPKGTQSWKLATCRACGNPKGDKCIPCRKKSQQKHIIADPERSRARTKKWAAKNRDKIAAYRVANRDRQAKHVSKWQAENRKHYNALQQRWRDENRAGLRDKYLRSSYGINTEQYEAMWTAQAGLCAICHMEPRSGKRLFVDHCHETLKIRGLLCDDCNVAIGRFHDNPDLVFQAVEYLIVHE